MNVGEIRSFARQQLDVDEEEYPNALLDSYLDEAFTRTVALEPRWPTYEYTWELVKPDDAVVIEPPPDLNIACVDSMISRTTGWRLVEVSPEMAEEALMSPVAAAYGHVWYTTYGGVLTLWPQSNPTAEEIYIVRGQRIPAPISSVDSFVPDCDVRLHRTLVAYVIALMYANQEDEVLEDTYMKRWQTNFMAARRAIFSARTSRPLVLNSGLMVSDTVASGRNPAIAWDI